MAYEVGEKGILPNSAMRLFLDYGYTKHTKRQMRWVVCEMKSLNKFLKKIDAS